MHILPFCPVPSSAAHSIIKPCKVTPSSTTETFHAAQKASASKLQGENNFQAVSATGGACSRMSDHHKECVAMMEDTTQMGGFRLLDGGVWDR